MAKADNRTLGWYLEKLGQYIGGLGHCRGRTGGLGDWNSSSEMGVNCIKGKVTFLGRDAKKFRVIDECSSFGNGQQ